MVPDFWTRLPIWSAVVGVGVFLWVCRPTLVSGEGVRDFRDGWLLNPEDTVLILDPNQHPTWDPNSPDREGESRAGWGVWAAAGQGALFSMVDLPLKTLETGVIRRGRTRTCSLAISWERLGDRLLVEDTGVVRMQLGANPRVGFRLRARRWLVAGEKVATGLETALTGRLEFRVGDGLRGNLGLWLHPDRPVVWHRGRGRRTLAEIKFFYPGSGLAFRLEQRGDGTPILSLEILGRLTTGLGLGFRADPETGSLGGSLVVGLGGPWLRTSHLVHPALGLTHRFHLGTGDPGACVW